MDRAMTGEKPIDLHGLASDGDKRTYECFLCGYRRTNAQVSALGGLCPNDGVSFRALGSSEKRHPTFLRYGKGAKVA